jgi:hypothetical protein
MIPEYLGGVLGALAHVHRVHAHRTQCLGHHRDLEEPGRVLAETVVIPGEPADDEVARPQPELHGDRMLARVKDG